MYIYIYKQKNEIAKMARYNIMDMYGYIYYIYDYDSIWFIFIRIIRI